MIMFRRIDCMFACALVLFILIHKAYCLDIITTIAGTGTRNYSGDNGQATLATFNTILGVALDSSGIYYLKLISILYHTDSLPCSLGNVYIADTVNHRIRKVTISTGIISTIAGTGDSTYSGDNGVATSAALSSPFDVALDSSGNLRFNL